MISLHSPRAKTLLIVSIALLDVGLLFLLVLPQGVNHSPSRCTSRYNHSLIPAASYFSEMMQTVTSNALGGHPIEGFEPSLFMKAYPALQSSDFECVEAFQGRYTSKDGAVIFTPTANSSFRTSAERSITSYGMGTLLENLGRRLTLPFSTNDEVNVLLQKITPIEIDVSE